MDRDPLSDSESYTSDFTYTAIMDNPRGGMTARFMSQASTSDDDLMDITTESQYPANHNMSQQVETSPMSKRNVGCTF